VNLAEARDALAAAVSTLDDVTCVAHPIPGNLRVGDAFVTVGRCRPGQFLGSVTQALSAYVVLGSDEALADTKVDELTVPLLMCVQDLYAADVSVEPQQIIVSGPVPGTVFALALSITLDLSS